MANLSPLADCAWGVVGMGDGRMEENAAYGAVLIRACEALRALVGIDGEDASSVDIAELAAAVRGRSPLLLEIETGVSRSE